MWQRNKYSLWEDPEVKAVEGRSLCWVYAAFAWLVGIWFIWGPSDLGASTPVLKAFVRIAGAGIIALGCIPAAAGVLADARRRFRVLVWCLPASVVFVWVGFREASGVLRGASGEQFPAVFIYVFSMPLLLLLANRRRKPLFTSLFGSAPQRPTELRSRYEEQIRKAASQEERNRLARDLHDSIKQQVFVIQTAAATAQARFDHDPDGTRQALEQVRQSAREAMTEMQVLLDQLRAAPLENVGLVEALKRQCEALRFRTDAEVKFETGTVPPAGSLPPGSHEAVFRVAQEALANIGRHARASHVRVWLGAGGDVFGLSIQDDGAGFDPNLVSSGMGISNMRSRAEELGGTLNVRSSPGAGVVVNLSVPYVSDAYAGPKQYKKWKLQALAATVFYLGISAALLHLGRSMGFLSNMFFVTIIFGSCLAQAIAVYMRARRGNKGDAQ